MNELQADVFRSISNEPKYLKGFYICYVFGFCVTLLVK